MDERVRTSTVEYVEPTQCDRRAGCAASRRVRRRVEGVFGRMKTVGRMRQTRHRGATGVGWSFVFTAAAYNRVRLRNLEAAA